ncbi:MAG: ABC transporter ATP-binding protein [Proteobacteria bacterium]|nr:ABC transporter ATP-binding protein [Pseudomonadota bacterium]
MEHIVAQGLSRRYGTGHTAVDALLDVSFSINSGEFVAVMGESGAGKSTLLSLLGAMNPPTSGRYVVDGIDVYGLPSEKRADFRREYLGFVFQSQNLVPYLTLAENVMLPLAVVKESSRKKREMARAALERVGLEDLGHRLPDEVSGGECGRAAIARAVVNQPPVILADEPTGSLDSATGTRIMKLLADLNGQGSTIIMVTHSEASAEYANRLIRIVDGRLARSAHSPKAGVLLVC